MLIIASFERLAIQRLIFRGMPGKHNLVVTYYLPYYCLNFISLQFFKYNIR